MQLNYSGSVNFNELTEIQYVKGGTVVSVDPGTATTAKDPENIFIVGRNPDTAKILTNIFVIDPKSGETIPVSRNKKVRVLEGCLHYRECQSQASVDRALKG